MCSVRTAIYGSIISTRTRGNASEAAVLNALVRRDFPVLVPFRGLADIFGVYFPPEDQVRSQPVGVRRTSLRLVPATEVNNPLFARFFDRFAAKDKGRGEDELRRELLAGLSGTVVEVGAGNGINFPYLPAEVEELIAVEPEPYLRRAATETATKAPVPVRVIDGTADALSLADASAGAVVLAGVLCSVPDQAAALAEIRRVLKPGGELRFYEHVRSGRPGFARYQDTVDRVWPHLMGGCHPNRDTLAAIERSGLRVERCRGFGFPSTARAYPVAPRILGVARR